MPRWTVSRVIDLRPSEESSIAESVADRGPARDAADPRSGPGNRAGAGTESVGVWHRWLPHLLAAGFFAWYTSYAVQRQLRMRTGGYDLGIFEQAVRNYSRLRAPISLIKGPGFNLLGDHFHPIIAVLAPAYLLFPSAITLLVAQAALTAVSIVPVGRLAAERLGTWPGAALALGYGMSWGIQQMIAFEFHEVCFALPLLSFGIAALLRERWWAAVLWVSPLLLVKEDLPLTVVAIGGYLVLRRQRRLGAAVMAAGVAAFVVIVTVILPGLSTKHGYAYWKQLGTGTNGDAGSFTDRLGELGTEVVSGAIVTDLRLHTVVMLLLPVLAVALRSPVILIALPTLAWRFASGNPTYWGTGLHYSALLMPILFFALLDAITRPGPADGWFARVVSRHARCLAAGSLVVGLGIAVSQPLIAVFDGTFWARDTRVEAARDVLALVPDGAAVAATNRLAPQLTSTHDVYLFSVDSPDLAWADWIVADVREPDWPNDPVTVRRQIDQLRQHGYRTVAERAGFVVLTRT